MTYVLADAKVRLGILAGDTTKDVDITNALNVALAVAENYCHRNFMFKAQTDTFYRNNTNVLQASRPPIATVVSLWRDGALVDASQYDVHNSAGEILLRSVVVGSTYTLKYTGGYNPLPADLEMALWLVFDEVWAGMQGGGVVGAGEISSITIPDVGTVRFSEGVQSGTPSGSASGMLSDPFTILAFYRRMLA
jgi:hypothetical protein